MSYGDEAALRSASDRHSATKRSRSPLYILPISVPRCVVFLFPPIASHLSWVLSKKKKTSYFSQLTHVRAVTSLLLQRKMTPQMHLIAIYRRVQRYPDFFFPPLSSPGRDADNEEAT